MSVKLADKYHGTGSLKFTSKDEWSNKEFVELDCDIGEVFDEETQKYVITNCFAIHYGKNGAHIVPMRRNE